MTTEYKRLIGYSSELSTVPGIALDFMVSSQDPFDASIVRLQHEPSDGEPQGFSAEVVANLGSYRAEEQTLSLGSRIHVPQQDGSLCPRSFSISAWVYPTRLGKDLQLVLGCWGDEHGFGLFVSSTGTTLRVGRTGGIASTAPLAGLREREWYFVAGSYDHATGNAEVVSRPMRPPPSPDYADSHTDNVGIGDHSVASSFFSIGGAQDRRGHARWSFNGKIEDPRLLNLALRETDIVGLGDREGWRRWRNTTVGAWDFSQAISSRDVVDLSGNGNTGVVVNMPTRAMTGHDWSGEVTHWPSRPEEYGAIHFHDDDLADARWSPSFTFKVPKDFESGAYAAHLRSDSEEEFIPFWVCPRPGQERADVAFLASTLTDIAYGNSHEAVKNPSLAKTFGGWDDIRPLLTAADHTMLKLGLLSQYEVHSDGSGVCYASRRRPLLSMRPGYVFPLTQAYHGFSSDLCGLRWLDKKGYSYEVITDEILHGQGANALAPFRTVVTGSHPEYWTRRMMVALQEYLLEGGRLIYLGGNGFYWVTSIPEFDPSLSEVRRSQYGSSPWEADPGESGHSTTGEPGGIWRYHGNNPASIVGTGFTAFGAGPAQPYKRTAASYHPRVAWIFDGVESPTFGDSGRFLGGAAGWEIDHADVRKGTPSHTVILATADGFSGLYHTTLEDLQASDWAQSSHTRPPIRADIVYLEYPNGGAVFSVSSMCWLGALEVENYAGPVSRITENVLRRFSISASSDS